MADAPESAAQFYVAVRAVDDPGEGKTAVWSAAEVTRVSRKDAGYDVEVTISGDLCPDS